MTQRCCLCDGVIDDPYGHNAAPLSEGKCCTQCNLTKVLPARVRGFI